MLISTNYNLLPDKKSCNNGSILFGATVSSICNALNQLNHVKFLGYSNFDVMRSTYAIANVVNGRDYMNTTIAESEGRITKGYAESHKFIYASTLLTNWICILISYESGNTGLNPGSSVFSPEITIELGLLNDSGSGYSQVAVLDNGIKFDSSESMHLSSETGTLYAQTFINDTGVIIPSSIPTNPTAVAPRPLYVPETSGVYQARGERLVFNVSCLDCKLKTFTTFDIYQSELS